MAIIFPEMPPELRGFFPQHFWNWWQSFKSFMLSGLSTSGDMTISASGKGVVLTNSSGVTKRVRLNDAGDGLIFEDV